MGRAPHGVSGHAVPRARRSTLQRLARSAPLKSAARRLFFAVALSTSIAHADVAPRRVVEVTVIGPPEDARVLESTIRELLSRLQLTMASEKQAPPAALLETVFVDLTYTYGTKVVVRNASGSTVLDRTIQRADTPAIQREQIAHAVRGAAEAELLEDEDRVAGRAPPVPAPTAPISTMTPTPPSTDVAPPAPTPPPVVVTTIVNPPAEAPEPKPTGPQSPLALEVATVAGVGCVADESVAARVGGSITLASRKGWRPSIALEAHYAFPFQDGDTTLGTQTKLFSLRAMPGVGLWRWKQFGLDAAAGVGIDVLNVVPSSEFLNVDDYGKPTTRVDFVMTGQLTGYWAILSDVSITLAAVVDVDPSSRKYVFDDAGTTNEILSPWHLRPMLLAGLAFTALGAPR